MENGIFREPEVEQLLSQYELFEIYTDDATSEIEATYRDQQIRITGYYANPTYIVLDSRDQLEVARESFTNSSEQFIAFLEEGLSDRPAFESRIQLEGLEIREQGKDYTVLTRETPWIYKGEAVASYQGEEVAALTGDFSASATFLVGDQLQGEYVLRARVVGGIYDGDDRLQTFAIPLKLRLKVDGDEQEES
ncbi:MAG: hypothetical protein CBC13_03475 [Planctomycetia bacterium TMED53]|nr:MAG: hypothetical protein CBC13_03475 [Planctomycetia bacterium TMED53]